MTKFDARKAIEIILYIANKVKEPTFHRISKLFYFADKKHLEYYGRLICDDEYVAMKHGPVPSEVYDILKSVRGDGTSDFQHQAKNAFQVREKYLVKPSRKADVNLLSESEEECINAAIEEYGTLSFQELTEKSHDKAWEAADDNDIISVKDIASTLSNSKELLKHLRNPYPGD